MLFGSSYSTDDIKLINDSQNKSQIPQIDDLYASQSRKNSKNSKFEYTPTPNGKMKRKKPKKKVKFNDKVDIVYVESYKEFNKIYEDQTYIVEDD
jgi:hypothetical protein